ncbi:uncharacterized protein LOC110679096 [Aedes aegypti]|nr:uncharacterized protein LOC110679096 [Aedes aegypti]
MRWYCAVSGCTNKKSSTKENPGITYHRFPADEARRAKWVSFCGRGETWTPVPSQGICSRHFHGTSYDSNVKHRRQLISNAIPELNPRSDLGQQQHQHSSVSQHMISKGHMFMDNFQILSEIPSFDENLRFLDETNVADDSALGSENSLETSLICYPVASDPVNSSVESDHNYPTSSVTVCESASIGGINDDPYDHVVNQVCVDLPAQPSDILQLEQQFEGYVIREADAVQVAQKSLPTDILLSDQEYDGFVYLLGWVAHKLKTTHPELGSPTSKCNPQHLPLYLANLSYGGLTSPTNEFIEMGYQLEQVFISTNGRAGFESKTNVVQKTVDEASRLFPGCDATVAQRYFKIRTIIRVRHINLYMEGKLEANVDIYNKTLYGRHMPTKRSYKSNSDKHSKNAKKQKKMSSR